MKTVKLIIALVLGAFMIFASSGHIMNPQMSSGFIPDFLPKHVIHILAAILEAGLGVLTLIPKTRKYGLWGIFVLMILFLPLHIVDIFRLPPVIGSQKAAVIRVFVQLILIFLPWYAVDQSKSISKKK